VRRVRVDALFCVRGDSEVVIDGVGVAGWGGDKRPWKVLDLNNSNMRWYNYTMDAMVWLIRYTEKYNLPPSP
jgi:hypothetical protein